MGDKIALYTDDNQVYRRFSRGIIPFHKVPYLRNGHVVGYDLFFNLNQRGAVAQIMKGQLLLDM